ncbi:hypothetical protein L7E55_10555 [Pelotomaculum isophthalicicum JI]|uniref:Uncharacterized protein n=1 Tax=Pelotomaculum isophthalicicum JI TaxID=947010 RepID=A0A9X4H2E9_9FIRM|nr:hypothetical protein [Pelotomaculum isophthalicicum]MDF9408790.1 hypothetical protein [Pelotomaculum isophthalicicum JI]
MKKSILNKIILLGIVVAVLVFTSSSIVSAKDNLSTSNLKYQFNSDISKTIQDLDSLKKNSTILESTSIIAKITPDQAFETASKLAPKYATQAENIVVEYYQLTNTGFNAFTDSAKQKNNSLSKDGIMKVPCYIVTFKGITRIGEAPMGIQAPIFHNFNIVIDANTGEPLYGFSTI